MKKKLFIFLISSTVIVYSKFLKISDRFKDYAVFHVHVKQLDCFSCGYNVLFNAARLEKECGFSNQYAVYTTFKGIVMNYLALKNLKPKAPSTNRTTEYLAQEVLFLQPFYHLHQDELLEDSIVPLLTVPTQITHNGGASEKTKQRLFMQERIKQKKHTIKTIRKYLSTRSHAVVHFLCYVTSARGVRHGILLSLVQNESGRGLYLCDNLNEPQRRTSSSSLYIYFLVQTFNISLRSHFKGPLHTI